MTNTCKNCNNHFKGHFCNHCGQSSETHEINFHVLWHDIQHGLFHFDNGLFYTAKQLFTRPGKSIREFIDGKRIRHFKPISLVILLATVYGFLYHTFDIRMIDVNLWGTGDNIIDFEKINDWLSTHYSWATLLTLPALTLGSYIAFNKQGYNYVEHFVLNSFLAGQKLIFRIVTFPLFYIYNGTPTLKVLAVVVTFVELLLMFWAYFQFFGRLKKIKSFLLMILSLTIFLFVSVLANTIIYKVISH